ncbi:Cytochrome b-c1 complex subunit 8 [Cyphellophora attinorum]|uniref:Cytochrome b-c1 complex subunit 8 n=1 Tax=Cyphellophora attinorum TaxID=1664694 RepID=A0A0N1P1F4_9EURO|nr:Cytochrome b-c1 complex subunit 8 [Phialophora attinorum]KPI43583.1 Cytochrome b-c1 complex subunit 8 [Phialophora attinorum]
MIRPTPVLRMQATRALRSGAHPDPKAGKYIGGWGDFGGQKQKGIITYALSANQQRPLAGTMHAAVFNVARRTAHQILYWLPPLLLGYTLMAWATERNEYLNSKPGRAEFADEE